MRLFLGAPWQQESPWDDAECVTMPDKCEGNFVELDLVAMQIKSKSKTNNSRKKKVRR